MKANILRVVELFLLSILIFGGVFTVSIAAQSNSKSLVPIAAYTPNAYVSIEMYQLDSFGAVIDFSEPGRCNSSESNQKWGCTTFCNNPGK